MPVPKNTYVGRRYIPKLFQNPNDNSATWTSSVPHESLTIVMWQGASYTSKQDVPVGIDIGDVRYWVRSADYNAQLSIYEQNVRDYHQYVIDQIGIITSDNQEFKTEQQNIYNNFKTEQQNIYNDFVSDNNLRFENFETQINGQQLQINNTDEMYIGSFFYQGSNTDIEADESLFFYVTYDGKKFTRINNAPNIQARDTSSIFYNEKFYLFRTKRGSEVYEFDVLVSEDLINWEVNKINVGTSQTLGFNTVWAPDLFIDDDGKMYILYSQEISATFSDDNNITRHNMRPYIVEITNLETLTFGTPRPLILDNNSRIDSTIVKKDNVYYLFIKDEATTNGKTNGTIELWTSTNLINWSISKNSLFNYPFEAPSIIKKNDTYIMYIDNKGTLNYGMYYTTSNDLLTWSEPIQIESQEILRHGDVRKVENIKEKKLILNNFTEATLKQTTDNNFIFNKSTKSGEISSEILPNVTNKYLKLMTLYMKHTSKAISIRFALTDGINYSFDNEYLLAIRKNVSDFTIKKFKERNVSGNSLSNNLFLVDKGDNTTLELYYKIDGVVMPEMSIISFNRKYENLVLNNDVIVDNISSYTQFTPDPYIGIGTGTINSSLISATGFECNYVKVNNICIVSYVAIPTTNLSSASIIATGLPKAKRVSYGAVPAIINSSTLAIGRGNLTVDSNGNLTTFYGESVASGNYIKGSVTYVCE